MAAVNWRRVIGLGVCALVATWLGWAAARRYHLFAPPQPRAPVEARIRSEVAEAARIGIDTMVLEREVPLQAGTDGASQTWSMPLAVGERECVAVIASAYGSGIVNAVTLVENDATLSVGYGGYRTAAHVQWCSLHASTLRVDISAQRRRYTPAGTPNALIVHVARGAWDRVGGPAALTRGHPSDSALGRLAMSYPEDAFAAHASVPEGATPIASAWRIAMGSALLVPGSPRTYATLYAVNAGDAGVAVNPRVDSASLPDAGALDAGTRHRARHMVDASVASDASALSYPVARDASALHTPVDAGPWNSPEYRVSLGGAVSTPLHDPLVDLGTNDFRRVLAVVDPMAIRSGCVVVVFRRALPLFSAEVRAFDPQTWRERDINHEGNTASDELCARPSAPVVYIAPDADQAEYTLEILAAPSR